MKLMLYSSGIAGGLLMLFWLLGMINPAFEQTILLLAGSACLVFIFIPLAIYNRHLEKKKIQRILRTYREKTAPGIKSTDHNAKTSGWSMNNSPFRERKSGLSWGGGNIKGAEARRGARKGFLQ